MKILLVVIFLSGVGLSFANEVCRPVYNWPKAVGNLSSQSWQIRYQLVKQEMYTAREVLSFANGKSRIF